MSIAKTICIVLATLVVANFVPPFVKGVINGYNNAETQRQALYNSSYTPPAPVLAPAQVIIESDYDRLAREYREKKQRDQIEADRIVAEERKDIEAEYDRMEREYAERQQREYDAAIFAFKKAVIGR